MNSIKSEEILIKSEERVRDFGEVFTPVHIVNKMLDTLPQEVFMPDKTFLEPACGEGAFIIEILKRKFANCKKRRDYTDSLKSVYGMELQEDNVDICIKNIIALCEEYFKPTKGDIQIINDHIIQADSLKIMKMLSDPGLYSK